MLIELLKAVLFGIVQGITEWLPISSTGHMILLNEFVKLDVSDAFYRLFEVVIQLGSIFAVVVLYFNKLFPFTIEEKTLIVKRNTFKLWGRIVVSCIPAVIVGLLFEDWIDEHFYNATCVALALIAFGIIFIVIETYNEIKDREPYVKKLSQISLSVALIIGIFQTLAAVFPGTSRSGATIIGALIIGVARPVAAEYTFLLAVPVMLGASLLKVIKYGINFSAEEGLILIVGMLTAFVVSLFVIRFLVSFVRNHDFRVFGYYRIALGLLVLLFFKLLF